MNSNLSAALGAALILIIPLMITVWLYNGIVGKEEKTMESWAQVEATYQRRADLIPALAARNRILSETAPNCSPRSRTNVLPLFIAFCWPTMTSTIAS